ncbi:MAG: ubiquinol-cytochrome C reductase, partial [Mycetocola sp.]
MAQDDNSGAELAAAASSDHGPESNIPTGTAVVAKDSVENPGFPPHRKRVTDLDPKKERTAERFVYS